MYSLPPSRRAATIKDIARSAGVSHATVSRVLRGNGPAARETRARVLAAAERLGYTPNRMALGLRVGATGMVAALVPRLDGPPTSDILANIADEFGRVGLSLTLHCCFDSGERQLQDLELIKGKTADAAFFIPAGDLALPARRELLQRASRAVFEAKIPVIFLDRHLDVPAAGCVCTDNEQAAFSAVGYLLSIGHRRIGFLSGPPLSSVTERFEGYRKALAASGIAFEPRWAETLLSDSYEAGLVAALQLLQRAPELTAVITYNPSATVGLVAATSRLGRSIPQDLSLVAFDDVPPVSATLAPLTHLEQDAAAIGRHAARLAVEMLSGGGPRHVRIPARLVVGQTTRPRA